MTMVTETERRVLLQLARQAIRDRLDGRPLFVPPPLEGGPRQGAFVTLRRRADGELRGCIGHVEPRHPLARTVATVAVAAAFSDPRFPEVAEDELPGLSLDISVLTPPLPLRAEEVEVGRHGLIVRCKGRVGLLLPQVAVERGWDAPAFLDWTCRKAGLAPGDWRHPAAEVLGFTAVVFGEDS